MSKTPWSAILKYYFIGILFFIVAGIIMGMMGNIFSNILSAIAGFGTITFIILSNTVSVLSIAIPIGIVLYLLYRSQTENKKLATIICGVLIVTTIFLLSLLLMSLRSHF